MLVGDGNALAGRNPSVLLVGCGSIGKRHARVLRELGVRELWICDPSAAQRKALGDETPVTREFDAYADALREKPEAVFILTPPHLHVPMALQALQAGCHVFCEKPLSDRLEGLDELEARIRTSGKAFMLGLCFRYHQGLLKAKALLDGGRIGRLVAIRAMLGEPLPEIRPDYKTLFTAQEVGVFDLVHEIDLALWFGGQRVRRVACVRGAYSDIGIPAPDVAEILVDFEDRCLASVHLDFFQHPRRRQLELMGTSGCVTVEFARWDGCTISLYESRERGWEIQELATERDDMFRDEDREFLDAITGGRPVRYGLEEGRRTLEVVLSAQAAG
jgi:predicted dehydrogenase